MDPSTDLVPAHEPSGRAFHGPPSRFSSRGFAGKELKAFWRRQFELARATAEDLYPQRVWVAWRLVRERARLHGLVGPGETLHEKSFLSPDPWTEHCGVFPEAPSVRTDPLVGWLARNPLPLLPPQPPGGVETPDYEIEADQDIHLFVDLQDQLAHRLGLSETQEGREGLLGLLDVSTVRRAFPTQREIVAFELAEVDRILARMTQGAEGEVRGESEMRRELFDRGYSRRETQSLIRLARKLALAQVGAEPEEDRAMLILNLQNLADRARTGFKGAVELGAYRLLMRAMGLYDEKPRTDEDDMREMVAIAQQVTQERRRLPDPEDKP